jgi:hypothetical protein
MASRKKRPSTLNYSRVPGGTSWRTFFFFLFFFFLPFWEGGGGPSLQSRGRAQKVQTQGVVPRGVLAGLIGSLLKWEKFKARADRCGRRLHLFRVFYLPGDGDRHGFPAGGRRLRFPHAISTSSGAIRTHRGGEPGSRGAGAGPLRPGRLDPPHEITTTAGFGGWKGKPSFRRWALMLEQKTVGGPPSKPKPGKKNPPTFSWTVWGRRAKGLGLRPSVSNLQMVARPGQGTVTEKKKNAGRIPPLAPGPERKRRFKCLQTTRSFPLNGPWVDVDGLLRITWAY